MIEYEVYIPLFDNDGTPFEFRRIERIAERLLAFFEGLTFFPQPNLGFWKLGNVVFRDDIVIFRILTDKGQPGRRFLLRLKRQLMKSLKQEAILIVAKDVDVL